MNPYPPTRPAPSRPLPVAQSRPALEIVELTPESTRPSIILQGGSGSGKTTALVDLLKHGAKLLVIGVEAKLQPLARYRAKAIYLRGATHDERYDRLMQFVDELAKGTYAGFDGIGIDGTGEIVDIIHRRFRAKLSSRAATLPMWDDIGIEAIDVFRTIRDAAGYASQRQGVAPMSIVATIAERRSTTPLGATFYEPLLPGKKAAEALPYQFEVMLRLSAKGGDDGRTVYTYHTTATDEWYAKSPPGVLEPTIAGAPPDAPKFHEIYTRLVGWYAGGTP